MRPDSRIGSSGVSPYTDDDDAHTNFEMAVPRAASRSRCVALMLQSMYVAKLAPQLARTPACAAKGTIATTP